MTAEKGAVFFCCRRGVTGTVVRSVANSASERCRARACVRGTVVRSVDPLDYAIRLVCECAAAAHTHKGIASLQLRELLTPLMSKFLAFSVHQADADTRTDEEEVFCQHSCIMSQKAETGLLQYANCMPSTILREISEFRLDSDVICGALFSY